MVNDIAIDARVLRFHFPAGQIVHSIAEGLPPLQHFLGVQGCVVQALSHQRRRRSPPVVGMVTQISAPHT